MCGIAGIVNLTGHPVDEALLRAMTTVQAHRGPDGEGIVCRGGAGLGHRRLAIIDLATGDQPMASEDGAIRIVFNGEIYNFRELRRELESRGARFATTSDTEVILRAYEADGPACVTRLRGMFAFAILDERARRLFLARDRAGIKPLVYAWDGRRLLFASEIKGILEDPGVPRELDWDALGDYLTYHYVPAPRTIFKAIRKLPPASTLVLPLEGGEPVVSRYWTLRLDPDQGPTEQEWIERLRAELADAVQSHMVSDVPIGAFLSGGVDSSTVVALMAQASSAPIRTFSIGFDEADFDELRFARQVAARYGTDHYELVVKPNALDVLPKLAWHFDEPFADSSAIPTYYVSKITREHVTVALSGDGGDENFAGYRRYARALALHERLDSGPARLAHPLCRLASALLPTGAPGQAWAGLLGAEPLERYFRLVTYQRHETLRRLLSDELADLARSAADPAVFSRLAAEAGAPDYVSALQHIDIATYLPDDILTKVDRTSMAVSLESRVPLLDHRLMELVATIPSGLKLREGTGKYLLKRAMANDLPPEILTRKKMGFGVPLGAWFRRELHDMTRDVLLGPQARQRGIFRTSEVEALMATHDAGRRDCSARLWSLICFELWMRQWVDRAPAAAREAP
ncbi:MAG: asparagine synthase (glutamine-hydrolyzing) [Candidatus Rokubacteria bacterium]|nr:asparagine synthase (glutamine-hydrolyzing) [Candidatus Rokubacteria bacterium]